MRPEVGLPELVSRHCHAALTGRSGSGKTAAAECAASRLSSAGVRVVYVKYTHHGVDLEGKDTWRVNRAGALASLAVGPGEAVVVSRRLAPEKLAELLARYADAFIVEGYRSVMEEYPDVIDVEGLGPEEACREAVRRILECLGRRG